MSLSIRNFGMHGSTGLFVLHENWLAWMEEHRGLPGYTEENCFGLGEVTHHSWEVDGKTISVSNNEWVYSRLLPDRSGFIAFENTKKYNNCLLLDALGKERIRLNVPWQLTGATDPKAQEVSEFDNISEPYWHPITKERGIFGVTGWVGERKFYFELNYKTGEFLWSVPIRD